MLPDLLTRLPDTFTVYVARHATPDRSRFDLTYHSLPGPGLTPHGKEEALALGNFFYGVRISRIFSSPFERAIQTASLALTALETAAESALANPAVIPAPDPVHPVEATVEQAARVLVETNLDLGEKQPTEIDAFLTERMSRAFIAAAQASVRYGPVAVVSHGSPVLALLRVLGLPVGVIERCRIYDNRNLVPMSGAWQVSRAGSDWIMRLAYIPKGTSLPQFMEHPAEISAQAPGSTASAPEGQRL